MRIKFHKFTVNFTANYAPKGPKTPNKPIEKFRNYTPMGLNRTVALRWHARTHARKSESEGARYL